MTRLESLLLGLVDLLLLVLVDNAVVIGVRVLLGDGSLSLHSIKHLESVYVSRGLAVDIKHQSSGVTHSWRFVLVF